MAPRKDETGDMDSVKWAKQEYGWRRALDVLFEAQGYWAGMDRFRRDRERNKRYCYGDQWKDLVEVDGKWMTEEEYIGKQGNIPLKNNLIRRLVRNVLGVYRSQVKEPTCYARDRDEQRLGETMTTVLQCNMQQNRMTELLGRTMEEFLISGMAVHRKWYGWRNETMDCWTDYVNPANFFMDSNSRDVRGWDVSMLGEIHDISFGALCAQFARSPEDYARLKEMYRRGNDRGYLGRFVEEFGYARSERLDFFLTNDPTRCRVIEVWRKETKPRYRCHDLNTGEVFKIETSDYGEMVVAENFNRERMAAEAGMAAEDVPLIKAEWMIDEYWHYYYLSPTGDVLHEGETPYNHKSHPYVVKAYPFIDGEVHSFVADVIDQQRYTNRLIMLYDFIMKSSAKGVLLFPEGCEPEGMSMEEIADEWGKADGIVFYKPKPGVPVPQQISSNSTNVGITELLNLQLKFFEDISGVNGALQGKPGYSGQSAALYNQQTQNSTTSLLDLLDSFSSFVREGAIKDVKNMQQFYDADRFVKIVGKDAWVDIDPARVADMEFDLSVVESTSTPAYRQMANEMLMQMWQAQAISVEQLLEHGSFPFGDELLQSLRSQKEQIAEGQVPSGIAPQVAAQAMAGADSQAMAKAEHMLRA